MAVLTRPFSAFEVQKAKPGTTDYELFVVTSGKKSGAFATNAPVRLPEPSLSWGIFPPCNLPAPGHCTLNTLPCCLEALTRKFCDGRKNVTHNQADK